MGPHPDPVADDDALPAQTEIVVVGGGIIGASAALSLAEQGIPVVLCEKGHIAGEQSSRNWGWCRKMGRDPREIPLIIESLRLWQGLNERVEAETGFRQSGIMYLAQTRDDADKYAAWLEHARDYQLDTRLLTAAEARELMPGLGGSWAGALYTASDGRAEPQKAAPAIANAARRHGAKILQHCAVRGLETSAGRVSAVVTEKGRIACSGVVLAGGAWSRLFCGNLGIDLPQLKVAASVMRTAPLDGGPEISVSGGAFGIRKRLDGGYTLATWGVRKIDIVPDHFRLFGHFLPVVRLQRRNLRFRIGRRFIEEWQTPRRWSLDGPSPFEAVRTLDPEPDPVVLDQAQQAVAATFPVFRDITIAERWGGMIDVTPDVVPVISPVEQLPGLVIATGFSGHGFGIGPAAGRLAADLAAGGPTIVDPTPFRLSRFTDGSRPLPSPLAS